MNPVFYKRGWRGSFNVLKMKYAKVKDRTPEGGLGGHSREIWKLDSVRWEFLETGSALNEIFCYRVYHFVV